MQLKANTLSKTDLTSIKIGVISSTALLRKPIYYSRRIVFGL